AQAVQVGGEHHDGAGRVDEAGGADADGGDVVPAREALDQVDDGVLDQAYVVPLGGASLDIDDGAGRVDDGTEHLGAADVDPDRQRLPARGTGATGRQHLGHAGQATHGRRSER